MKDFLKQDLQVGDVVIYFSTSYREFKVNRIVKITECFVFIDEGYAWRKPFKQPGQQVIKHPDQKVLDTPAPNN